MLENPQLAADEEVFVVQDGPALGLYLPTTNTVVKQRPSNIKEKEKQLPSREEDPAGETGVAHRWFDDLESAVGDEKGYHKAAVDVVDAPGEQRCEERQILVFTELLRWYRAGHERT